jgi:hypothetical protein
MQPRAHKSGEPPSAAGVWSARAVWLVPALLWAFGAWVTFKYAVDVPYWDSWEFVEVVAGERAVTPSLIWSQHNEHRLVVQTLFELAWARFGAWNQKTAAFFPLIAIAVAAMLFIWRAVRERPYLTGPQRAMLIVTLSFWFFTLRQTDVLLWSILLCWAVLVLVLVVFEGAWARLVTRGERAWLVALCLPVAAGTTGQGLALCVFVVAAAAAAWAARDRSARRLSWLAGLGAALVGVYFWGFESQKHHPPLSAALERPMAAIAYCAAFVGGPFTARFQLAVGLGAVALGAGLVAAGALVRRLGRVAPWEILSRHPLLAVSAIIMLAVAAGRVGFGAEQAIASRYAPFAVLLAASVLLFVLDRLSGLGGRFVTAALLALLVATVPLWYTGYRRALHDAWVRRDVLTKYRDCVTANAGDPRGCSAPDVYPVAEILARRTALLRARRLSFFAGRAP